MDVVSSYSVDKWLLQQITYPSVTQQAIAGIY